MGNAITEGKDRQLPPDQHGEILSAPTPAALELRQEILDAWRHKEAGEGDAMRSRSCIESRSELRLAAVNESFCEDHSRSTATIPVEKETALQWADLDATDFGRIRSASRRESALEAIAGHMRASTEYGEKLRLRSPALAEAARILNEERAQHEKQALARAAAAQRDAAIDAATRSRESLIDAAALAAVAATRTRETARVVEQLASSPSTRTEEFGAARSSSQALPQDVHNGDLQDAERALPSTRVLRRPIAEEELSQALSSRYIVTQEKRGLFDKGSTEFTLRSGADQGKVAFVDAGKTLNTARDDKATIRAMVEVASAKHWREITVSGTENFRRNAWLEASLAGMQVRGYEPREADRSILADLQRSAKPTNSITAVEREKSAAKSASSVPARPASAAAQTKHVNGDALTHHEKTVLENSRAILDSKALGEQFTKAALTELESRLRGERVYVGEIVDHGKAPYKFDKDNDDSYFVTLRTRAGDQVVWGKGLAEAMEDRKAGEQVVLQNVGKRDVTVHERLRDAQGHVVGTRPKESQLNAWKAELLSRFSEKARTEFSQRSTPRQPSLEVYDAKAPRVPVKPVDAERAQGPRRAGEQQRNARER